MTTRYVVKPGEGRPPHAPDAFTVHDDGRTTSHRTGLVERGFESLAAGLAAYDLTEADIEEVTNLPKFSERPPASTKR